MRLSRKQKAYLIDLAERTFWTLAQVTVGIVSTELADIDSAYAVPIAAGLAVVKGLVAKKVGSSNTAAMLPAGPDSDLGGTA